MKLQAYNDRTFDFTVATPPASYFLKAAVRNPTPISVSSCPIWSGLLLATLLTTLSGYLSPKGFLTLFLTLNVTNVDHRNWCGVACALCGALCSRMGSLRRILGLRWQSTIMVQRRPAMPKWTTRH